MTRIFYSVECDTAIGHINNVVGADMVWRDAYPIRHEYVDGYKHYIITLPSMALYKFIRKSSK
jgi:hypothetical protein